MIKDELQNDSRGMYRFTQKSTEPCIVACTYVPYKTTAATVYRLRELHYEYDLLKTLKLWQLVHHNQVAIRMGPTPETLDYMASNFINIFRV